MNGWTSGPFGVSPQQQPQQQAAEGWGTGPAPSAETPKIPPQGTPEYERVLNERKTEWEAACVALTLAKDREMELRKAFVADFFDPNQRSGTERLSLGDGTDLKAVKTERYGFVKNAEEKTDKKAIDAALTRIEKEVPHGEYIAEHLIKWTPELSVTEYKKLSDAAKAIIDVVIVTTQGAPSLDVVKSKR